jgi:hypothetical protein
MSNEEIITVEERVNKLGIKIDLSYDFGSARSDGCANGKGRAEGGLPQ